MINKVWLNKPHENWIVDRFHDEFCAENTDIVTLDVNKSDVLWLLADWCWERIPLDILASKKVITSVHHIVTEKWNSQLQYDFEKRDQFTTVYHVPCEKTKKQIENLTKKGIVVIPFWVNNKMFCKQSDRAELRKKYLPKAVSDNPDSFILGSFQRDTEGNGINEGIFLPKLEKGPDILADYLCEFKKKNENLHILLGGWRRQYLIERFKKDGIEFTYYEFPQYHELLGMYSILDLYVVSARVEGGPQSIVECAAMEVPIISTDVGLASAILSKESIGSDLMNLKPNVDFAKEKVKSLFINNGGMNAFRNLIESL